MREIFADTAIYMIGRGVPAALGFLVVVIFVRSMGEQGYGIYAITFSGANVASTIAVGWLSQAILRFQPRSPEVGFERTVATGVAYACGAAAVGAIALLMLTAGAGFGDPVLVGAGALLGIGLTIHTTYTASLQAALRSQAVATMEIFRAVVTVLASLVGIATIRPAYAGAVLGTGVSYLASGALAGTLAVRSMRTQERAAGVATAPGVRELFWFGWPISIWLGASLSFPFVERSIIHAFLGPVVTGQYAAIYDVIYRSCGFVLLPIALAIHPRVMRAQALGQHDELRKLWRIGLTLQLAISLAMVGAVTLAGAWIIALTGVHVTDKTLSLVLPLAAAGCVWQIALVSHKLLEAHRKTRRMLAFLLAALLIDMIVNIVTVPRFGAAAAAYALLATGVLYTVCVGVTGVRTTTLVTANSSGTIIR